MPEFRLSKKQTNLIIGALIVLFSAIYQSFQPKIRTDLKQFKTSPTHTASPSADLVRVKK